MKNLPTNSDAGQRPDTDELVVRDFIYGAVFAICGVVLGVATVAAIFLK